MSHHPATPLPWRVNETGIIVSDSKPFPESVCQPVKKQDAANIVTAANCHLALFGALRGLLNAVEEIGSFYEGGDRYEMAKRRLDTYKQSARAALLLADTEENRDGDRYEAARHDAQCEREELR